MTYRQVSYSLSPLADEKPWVSDTAYINVKVGNNEVHPDFIARRIAHRSG